MNRKRMSVFSAVFLVSLVAMNAVSAETAGKQSTSPQDRAFAFETRTVTTGPTTTSISPSADIEDPKVSYGLPSENLTVVEAELPALPIPVPAPTENYFDEPIIDLGRIQIPKIGLDTDLGQGISLDNINRGPSHWPGSALPGELGNAVIAGHRTTHGGPFRNLNELVNGDQVIFTVGDTRSVYEVFETEIVTPKGLHILDQTRDFTATLFACHPPGSSQYRYVVKLRLLESNTISVYVDQP